MDEKSIAEEKLLRQSFQDKLHRLTKEIEDDHRAQLRSLLQAHADKSVAGSELVDRDHRMRFASLQHELEVSLDAYKRSLTVKHERERQEGRDRVKEYEEGVTVRLKELRDKNKKEIEALQLDHAAQVSPFTVINTAAVHLLLTSIPT